MQRDNETIELTKASSKGQIVIPASIRKRLEIKEGSMFGVAAIKDMIVLKKLDIRMKPEDLKALKLIEEAWKDMGTGRYKTYSKKAFFEELKKW